MLNTFQLYILLMAVLLYCLFSLGQLKLLNWKDCPILGVSETNLLLNKLQDLSLAKLRPYYTEPSLPPDALSSIRLALATNLGRAILDE